MFLWISGFLKGDVEDDSLKYQLTVRPEFEALVMEVLGWKSLDECADGEWLLTGEQVQRLVLALNEQLPTELDLFIGVRS
ncbi:pyocin S6 family toxin immunity protein [Pseudomonas fluorescens]|jgi:hypothetical protein|uniref:Uncharacterized protein n=1 Tax=Pseudomonas fluorescens TaxID=294 RepID=A0A5E7A2R0_PSEFL|nr:pyocin S6 family toxin immunity protein [Pseudomonas fluorescens]VVN73208.1 hypothetical protein PS704_00568 [Pseudomonas fluorescens]